MKYLLFLFWVGCTPVLVDPPPGPPAPSDASQEVRNKCAKMCAHLQEIGCTEFKKTGPYTCEQFCSDLETKQPGLLNVGCVSSVSSCTEVDHCNR